MPNIHTLTDGRNCYLFHYANKLTGLGFCAIILPRKAGGAMKEQGKPTKAIYNVDIVGDRLGCSNTVAPFGKQV